MVSRANRLPLLALLTLGLFAAAIAMVFYYAPVDQDGFNQKIFYFHVPIAFTAYACFGWGAWRAFVHLWRRTPGADLESYVAIHQGVIFGVVLIPVSWLAIHLAQDFIHPVVFTDHGPQLGGSQLFTFLVCLAAMLSLAACLYHVELAGKRLDARLKSLRELLA